MEEETFLASKISTAFRHDILKELLKSKFSNPKNKMSEDTVELVAELAKTLVIEAAARACYQAQFEDKTTVTLDHVECTIPQMMLDFP
ncbi:unnamed protein product [Ceutorhynchus assimilis]|uniref:Centromere protein X n=1 Tax=Ceutorhynchus assimilis TaxID=467358 RepID=A0A9N9MPD2_9CUCU|nr:unnamed protein product [Ceutorhynchus assimilis]